MPNTTVKTLVENRIEFKFYAAYKITVTDKQTDKIKSRIWFRSTGRKFYSFYANFHPIKYKLVTLIC